MWKKSVSICVSVVFTCLNVCAQSAWMEWEEQIGEEADLSSWEEQYENLSELAEHPFNINMVTKEELEQLPFLSFVFKLEFGVNVNVSQRYTRYSVSFINAYGNSVSFTGGHRRYLLGMNF